MKDNENKNKNLPQAEDNLQQEEDFLEDEEELDFDEEELEENIDSQGQEQDLAYNENQNNQPSGNTQLDSEDPSLMMHAEKGGSKKTKKSNEDPAAKENITEKKQSALAARDRLGQTDEKPTEFPEISDAISKVASHKGANIVLIVLVIIATIYMLYKALGPTKEEIRDAPPKVEVSPAIETVVPPQNHNNNLLDPKVPAIPEPPKLDPPTPPPAPVPPVVPTMDEPEKIATAQAPKIDMPNIDLPPTVLGSPEAPVSTGLTAEQKLARLKSTMTLIGGGGGGGDKSKAGKTNGSLIDSGASGDSTIQESPVKIVATKIGNLNKIVGQGKLIDAVLDTAINSDLPGLIRAIVSVNVYSESGTSILIPKGSRLIGTYSANITTGMSRISIMWTRLIRPDGVDIALASPSTDSLGRTGLSGFVDNKYFEIFANSILLSIINISLARLDDINKKKSGQDTTTPVTSTTTTSTTGTTTSTTAVPPSSETVAITAAEANLGSTANSLLQQQITALKPTITVDQGTRIKVFVAKDLQLPPIIGGPDGVNVLQ